MDVRLIMAWEKVEKCVTIIKIFNANTGHFSNYPSASVFCFFFLLFCLFVPLSFVPVMNTGDVFGQDLK